MNIIAYRLIMQEMLTFCSFRVHFHFQKADNLINGFKTLELTRHFPSVTFERDRNPHCNGIKQWMSITKQ
jgi:hypothetical protein